LHKKIKITISLTPQKNVKPTLMYVDTSNLKQKLIVWRHAVTAIDNHQKQVPYSLDTLDSYKIPDIYSLWHIWKKLPIKKRRYSTQWLINFFTDAVSTKSL
jgi:hypothetical protein